MKLGVCLNLLLTASLGDAGSAGLGSSGLGGSSSGLGAPSGLPHRSSGIGRHAEHDVAAYQSTEHGIGGPHTTFTANRLDPRVRIPLSTKVTLIISPNFSYLGYRGDLHIPRGARSRQRC